MIVDVHTHIPTHRNDVPESEARYDTTMRPDRRNRLTNSFEDYAEAMAPVDRAIVFGIARLPDDKSAGLDVVAPEPVGDVNAIAAELAGRFPEKVIGFMSVHPDMPSVLDEMERCRLDLSLRGMKLAPNYQDFDPLGHAAWEVYGYAQRHGLPIVFHQGTSPMRTAPLRYAHPLVMDEVAIAFPDLKVVMAHMAHPWHADCIAVVRKHPNVYADVSAQFYRPWSMYNGFRLAYEWRVMNKLLFASDWPVTTPEESIGGLRRFNDFASAHHLPEVPVEEFERIISRPSLTLLGLE